MSTRISTKQKLITHLESIDSVLKDIVFVLSKRNVPINLEPLVVLLLERDEQLKSTLNEVESQHEIQKKIDVLRADCAKSDRQIQACQLQLKKAEVLLSTALYYSRQKLDAMAKAVKNPVDVEELVRFSHRISAAHGVSAPDNWVQGDPRRPYPNREEIRRGYLGHLDDNGQFRPSLLDALSETAAVASLATPAPSAMSNTPPVATILTTTPNNPTLYATVPTVPGVSTGTHALDTLSLSGSPNMILPGVNMVSSPITVSQSHTTSWPNTLTPPSAEAPSAQVVVSRPPTSSLAAMLEPHSRPALAPPHPSLRSLPDVHSAMAVTTHGPKGSGLLKTSASGHRLTFTLSPGTPSLPHVSHTDPTSTAGPSPKSTVLQHKQVKRKMEDIETMSSDTTSDSSSGDD